MYDAPFHQNTLIKSPIVVGSGSVTLKICCDHDRAMFDDNHNIKINNLIEAVGLSSIFGTNNITNELSIIMDHRSSPSLQLSQHKHIIILDDPFVVFERYLMVEVGIRGGVDFLLIFHNQDIAKIIMVSDGQT